MAIYGPTLMREIQAAGLGSLNIAATSDTILGWDDLTTEEQAHLQVVLDAHDPDAIPQRALSRKAFLLKLDALGKYEDFQTLKPSLPAATQIHFDEEPGFYEGDPNVADLATALSVTLEDIFGIGT